MASPVPQSTIPGSRSPTVSSTHRSMARSSTESMSRSNLSSAPSDQAHRRLQPGVLPSHPLTNSTINSTANSPGSVREPVDPSLRNNESNRSLNSPATSSRPGSPPVNAPDFEFNEWFNSKVTPGPSVNTVVTQPNKYVQPSIQYLANVMHEKNLDPSSVDDIVQAVSEGTLQVRDALDNLRANSETSPIPWTKVTRKRSPAVNIQSKSINTSDESVNRNGPTKVSIQHSASTFPRSTNGSINRSINRSLAHSLTGTSTRSLTNRSYSGSKSGDSKSMSNPYPPYYYPHESKISTRTYSDSDDDSYDPHLYYTLGDTPLISQ